LALFSVAFPFAAGGLGARLVAGRIQSRLGLPVTIAQGRAGLVGLRLRGLTVGPPGAALVDIDVLHLPYVAAWGRGTVIVERARVDVPDVSALARRVRGARGARAGGEGASGRRRLPAFEVRAGALRLASAEGAHASAVGFSARFAPGDSATVNLEAFSGALPGITGSASRRKLSELGASKVEIAVALDGIRPRGWPRVRVEEGFVQVLPRLGLSGVNGQIVPGGDGVVALNFQGSYGGARERLWHAEGRVRPGRDLAGTEGQLSLRADRFSLGKIRDVLGPAILDPDRTMVDASLDLGLSGGVVTVMGDLQVAALSVFHEALASEPMRALNLALKLDARIDPERRSVDLKFFEGRLHDLVGRVSGNVTLAPGTHAFEDGSMLRFLPRIDLTLDVPPLECQKLLDSFPAALVPHLAGFELRGKFETHLQTRIDYADLEALSLEGKVGINGCKVLRAPESVQILTSPDEPITRVVEVPPPADRAQAGAMPEELIFAVGPDNPDFVPYEEISIYLINSLLTTEDSGFFKHHGFATSEFKTALKRNLARGRFRQGASSITMQMVKNLLLSHEKTMSRKLQELFLVWYIEQVMPKERILELYLNGIEFGPRIYGIGPAARHYFHKLPGELLPQEAAFISSILPSPKRRYVQYCKGALSVKWDAHIKRILKRAFERGRLSQAEYDLAIAEPVAFDVSERNMTETECLDWIKRITTERPGEDDEPPVEGDENQGFGAIRAKLR
jgi:hypothetical protein